MSQKSTGSIDKLVGARVRARRLQIGMSQEKLAELLGLTFQQVQKYEKGANRISIGRLIAIAKALQVSISYFLEDAGEADDWIENLVSDKDTIRLVQDFRQIRSPIMRQAILDLIRASVEEDPGVGVRRRASVSRPA